MKKDIIENPSAFPTIQSNEYAGQILAMDGMTLRDYFAAKALPEFITDNATYEQMAEWAYNTADAMLKERAKNV